MRYKLLIKSSTSGVNGMNGKRFWLAVFFLLSFSLIFAPPVPAQPAARHLTLIYSNNMNGEIEPCPT
jgi:hypothetical protein